MEKKIPKELPVRSVSQTLKHRSFVFYGRSGTGKTTLAGSFPSPILLLDMDDKGTDSIHDLGDDVQVYDIKEWEDLEITYWWLKKNPGRYKTIVIDTMTGAQDMALKKILEGTSKDADKAGEWGVMTKREWGQAASLMKSWITNIRSLTDDEMEVVFNVQERIFNAGDEVDPEEQLDPEIGPRLMPSVKDHLNASVHVIGNTFIREKIIRKQVEGKRKPQEVPKTQYCLRIGPNPIYITKVRKPKRVKVPPLIVNPSYEDILSFIEGEA